MLAEAGTWPGIFAVRGWVNEGSLSVGDDIMKVRRRRRHPRERLRGPSAARVPDQDRGAVSESELDLRRRQRHVHVCRVWPGGVLRKRRPASYPRGCPSREPFEPRCSACTAEGEDAHLARNAGLVEAHGYCRLTRIEEIMDFARRCGYSKLGLAFCIGLQAEAAVTSRVLRANGFSVDSVACKNGSLPKEELGLGDEDKVAPGGVREHVQPDRPGAGPGPAGTELNLLLGLCVGHDSLFMKHSVAPVTVLAAKDRVLGHNPLAAIYMADGYYCDKLFPKADDADAAGA